MGGASVEGATLGSTSVAFPPGEVKPGSYAFAVGTAGSATLVFQTVLPALMLASETSEVVIEGGTHNQAAPPFDFLARTFLPLVQRMGVGVELTLERYGFYPAGGGRIRAKIQPVRTLTPLHLGDRGEITTRRVIAVVANLPRHIAEREAKTAAKMLGWDGKRPVIEVTSASTGPGNVVMVEVGSSEVTEILRRSASWE